IFAKPGDLLFTYKVVFEQSKLNTAQTPAAQYNEHKMIMVDRYNAYLKLSETNNCVQGLLAKDQLVSEIKNTFVVVKSSKENLTNFYEDFLISNFTNAKKVGALTSSCGFNAYIASLAFPSEYNILKSNLNSDYAQTLDDQMAQD